jgi:hypothetical protein
MGCRPGLHPRGRAAGRAEQRRHGDLQIPVRQFEAAVTRRLIELEQSGVAQQCDRLFRDAPERFGRRGARSDGRNEFLGASNDLDAARPVADLHPIRPAVFR